VQSRAQWPPYRYRGRHGELERAASISLEFDDEAWVCREALARLAEGPVDLVLSDVVMPDLDGHALFLEVRERHPEIPVVLMTAFHFDKDHIIKRSRIEGLEGVIFKKPVDPKRLCEVLLETTGRLK